jgi:hypothetical protein
MLVLKTEQYRIRLKAHATDTRPSMPHANRKEAPSATSQTCFRPLALWPALPLNTVLGGEMELRPILLYIRVSCMIDGLRSRGCHDRSWYHTFAAGGGGLVGAGGRAGRRPAANSCWCGWCSPTGRSTELHRYTLQRLLRAPEGALRQPMRCRLQTGSHCPGLTNQA